ncbi:MAG: hypothetical protein JST32_14130 [Bacteroidetes bacterium]|nr:hypothetical protein [Bacteroidota bacterium]
MNRKLLYAIFIGILWVIMSCQKSSGVNLSGRCQETKLTMYETNAAGAKLYDTTYTQPFTDHDFAEFEGKTFVVSTDHYFYLNIPGQPNATQQISPVIATWNYTSFGNGFVLSTQSTFVNPGGFFNTDTVTIVNPHLLRLHTVGYGHDGIPNSVSDAYYSK